MTLPGFSGALFEIWVKRALPSEKTGSVLGCGRIKVSAAGKRIGVSFRLYSDAAARNEFGFRALGVAHASSVQVSFFS
jgi:hypothetical protein